ncbi:hypothetical protein LCGC14_0945040 [marine sediment metagenome]|uniref:Uncharacterized protein n=1 Tax=marine sediment metagenome TaxID=412755 RepID=A0A0F9P527_9ZZZZ
MPVVKIANGLGDSSQVTVGNYNFTDDGGTQIAYTIFTLTGDVLIQTFGICDVALESGGVAKIELGVSGDTAAFIAQATATELIANEVWIDATPTLTKEILDPAAVPRTWIVANGQDVILTISAADLTAGDIDFYALWRPLSPGASVVAA